MKVVYKLSNRESNGKNEVIVWVTVSREVRPQMRSGVYVDQKYFEVEKVTSGYRCGNIKVPNRRKLNFAEVAEVENCVRRLKDFTDRILHLIEVCGLWDAKELGEMERQTKELPIQEITLQVINKLREQTERKNEKSIYELAEIFLRAKKYSEGRERVCKVLFRAMRRYELYQREAVDVNFAWKVDSLSAELLEDFIDYLRNEHELYKQEPELMGRILRETNEGMNVQRKTTIIEERGQNTIATRGKIMKCFCRWLYENKYVKKDVTQDFHVGGEKYGTPYYLTIEERNIVREHDFGENTHLSTQRDIFIFQCMIGCRVSDLYSITEDNIHNGVLEYMPHKTKDETQTKARVPLSETALQLIEKYRGQNKLGNLFPFISQQRYNDAIKDVLTECGITRKVLVRNSITGENEVRPINEIASSHMARRTFVGAAYSKVKDPNIIGKMSGHVEGSKAFNRYRTIDDDILKDVIGQIE